LLDLLTKDSAKEPVPYDAATERVVAAIMRDHPDFDEDEVRWEIYNLY